jgi:hypothetical protein
LALDEHNHNPLIVTVLTIFHGLVGILWVIIGFTLLFIPSASERFHDTIMQLSIIIGPLTNELMGLLFICSAVVALSVAWAFWVQRPWARVIALIMAIINILIEAATQNWLDLGINLLILAGLFHPTISAMFHLNIFSSEDD